MKNALFCYFITLMLLLKIYNFIYRCKAIFLNRMFFISIAVLICSPKFITSIKSMKCCTTIVHNKLLSDKKSVV